MMTCDDGITREFLSLTIPPDAVADSQVEAFVAGSSFSFCPMCLGETCGFVAHAPVDAVDEVPAEWLQFLWRLDHESTAFGH